MREDFLNLKETETAQREELLRFFPESLVQSFSNWQKSSWLEIMRRCRFGRLFEDGARKITMGEMSRPCTTLLAKYKETIQLYVCDGVNVTAWRVDVLNGWELEHMRQWLYSLIVPANVDVSELEGERRGLLLSTLEKCFDDPNFILA